ncbi:MerR family transcriptional regulator [Clostridium sp. 'deep sea']|uniref:MerR family transcriptional regulator n=1 Tax=Clostridium sp. 'deep sea' TaxID=2779445 RepID=UPI0018966B74|nr:MerR family transcriptional regulator [Clostridium sp. 'deep sea']QOR35188.1 MerR family transcriptional regulator [Clostridium sp. 'deep sea']
MKLQTISQVAKNFSISTRTLRYYEQIGLITPSEKENYAYRVYDLATITRLRQIIILRKLRIPLKQIAEILKNVDVSVAIEVFQRNLVNIEDEITALSTIRNIVKAFIEHLDLTGSSFALPDDEGLLEIVDSLTVSKINFKVEKKMEKLNQASDKLSKMQDKDVRIVYLPPMTVAAAYASGENCEGKANDMINQFVKDSGLLAIKPDARSFGFDCFKEGDPTHLYEVWVSIPKDMEIPAPLVKRTFNGGLYAAHVLRSWDFKDRCLLKEWINASDKYDNDWDFPRCSSPDVSVGQFLEETLNYYNFAQNGEMKDLQLDILYPIKEKMNERI